MIDLQRLSKNYTNKDTDMVEVLIFCAAFAAAGLLLSFLEMLGEWDDRRQR